MKKNKKKIPEANAIKLSIVVPILWITPQILWYLSDKYPNNVQIPILTLFLFVMILITIDFSQGFRRWLVK